MDGSGPPAALAPGVAASPAFPALRARAARAGPRGIAGARDWLGFAAMTVGMFMAFLDIQIVASSLGEIQAGLAASAEEVNWIQTAYLIAEVVMIPLSGYLSRCLGMRALFAASALGFAAMSIGCAAAGSLDAMILFRALQGFMGGAMIPTVFAVTFSHFAEPRRTSVSVAVGLVATLAPTVGPTLGGYLTGALSWHWLFLINVGPGVLVAAVVWRCVDLDRPDRGLLRAFDLGGFLAMAVFLGCLEYVLEEGPRHDWLADATIRGAAAACATAAILFVWRGLTARTPVVELRAFADRNFALGSLFSFVIGVAMYGGLYLVPLYLGQVRGFSALQIGQVMAVTGIVQFLSAPLAGALSRLLELRVMLAAGLALFSLGIWMMASLTADWGADEFLLPQVVRGSALMICMVPVNALALGTLPPDRLQNASGLYNLMRNLGGGIGLALLNTIMSDRLQLHWNRLAAHVNPARLDVGLAMDRLSTKLAAVIPGDPDKAALQVVARLVAREATVMTLNDCLLVLAVVSGAALLLLPLVRKPRAEVAAGH